MTWQEFYLICFIAGFVLSLLSVLTGTAHAPIPHVPIPHVHIQSPHAAGMHGAGGHGVPWLNFATLTAFLTWFGGTGYLLERFYGVWFLMALAVAVLSGLGGAAVVLWFLLKLSAGEHDLDPADYEMIGVLGTLSMPIRQGGTGELVFSQEGVRHVAGARSESGLAIPKGAEVVVTRYEKGIAYVRRWEEMTGGAEDWAVKES
jgi:membrane protein implicated in regulation of membrane protease activity